MNSLKKYRFYNSITQWQANINKLTHTLLLISENVVSTCISIIVQNTYWPKHILTAHLLEHSVLHQKHKIQAQSKPLKYQSQLLVVMAFKHFTFYKCFSKTAHVAITAVFEISPRSYCIFIITAQFSVYHPIWQPCVIQFINDKFSVWQRYIYVY